MTGGKRLKYLSLAIALALCAACGLSLLKNATDTRNIILDRKHETTFYDSEGNSVSESDAIEGSPYEDKEVMQDILDCLVEERFTDALDILSHELEKSPSNPWLLCAAGEIYEKGFQNPITAAEYYEKAYEADPSYPQAVYVKGIRHIENGESAKGIELLSTLVGRIDTLSANDQMYSLYSINYLAQVALVNESIELVSWLWSHFAQCDYTSDFDLYTCAVYLKSVEVVILHDLDSASFSQALEEYAALLKSSAFDTEKIQSALNREYPVSTVEMCNQFLKDSNHSIIPCPDKAH